MSSLNDERRRKIASRLMPHFLGLVPVNEAVQKSVAAADMLLKELDRPKADDLVAPGSICEMCHEKSGVKRFVSGGRGSVLVCYDCYKEAMGEIPTGF